MPRQKSTTHEESGVGLNGQDSDVPILGWQHLALRHSARHLRLLLSPVQPLLA